MRMTMVCPRLPVLISDSTDRRLAPTPSTINNMGIVCDTSANDSYPCHLTLDFQMPTLGRTITRRKMEMTWFVSRTSLRTAPMFTKNNAL